MTSKFPSFENLTLSGWRQFKRVDLEIHPRLTVITGANGAGKSTILNIFAQHYGQGEPFLSTPTKTKSSAFEYIAAVFKIFGKTNENLDKAHSSIGTLSYNNGARPIPLAVPQQVGAQYNVMIMGQQPVTGIHFSSHRPLTTYRPLQSIPVNVLQAQNVYQQYLNEINNRRKGANSSFSPIYKMKEALISMAMFGEGNSSVDGNAEAHAAYTGFTDVLRKILPKSLGFVTLDVRAPDIVMVTKTGEFMIDSSSGGLSTLIDIAYRLYFFSLFSKNFTVTFDEPENHLHPLLQKNLMPSLLKAFPNAQFIIATHSPFMVSSVKDSNVYVLKYQNDVDESIDYSETDRSRQAPDKHIVSQLLDTFNKSGSANAILREVLGIPSSMPDWVSDDIENIVREFRNKKLSKEMLSDLRRAMSDAGLEEYYVEALSEISYND